MRHQRIRGKLYEAPLVETTFEEKPILEMAPYIEGSCLESLGFYKGAPFCIRLLCRLNPIPLDVALSALEAKIIKQTGALEAINLYPTITQARGYEHAFDTSLSLEASIPILWDGEGNVLSGIEILWEEKGLVQWKEGDTVHLFSEGNIDAYHLLCTRNLFMKPFLFWDNSIVIKETFGGNKEEEIHILPASSPMCLPIFPYGGYYRPGLPLEQIEPLFLQVMEQDHRTRLSITRGENWKHRGIIPPHPGRRGNFAIEFLGGFEPLHLLSLAETILGGHIKIVLKEQEEESLIEYASFLYEIAEGEKDLYWISFQKCHSELG